MKIFKCELCGYNFYGSSMDEAHKYWCERTEKERRGMSIKEVWNSFEGKYAIIMQNLEKLNAFVSGDEVGNSDAISLLFGICRDNKKSKKEKEDILDSISHIDLMDSLLNLCISSGYCNKKEFIDIAREYYSLNKCNEQKTKQGIQQTTNRRNNIKR